MNNRYLYNRIVRGGGFKLLLIFTVATTFFSCENFMNGSELKQKFDEAVEYANAESFTVRFSDEGGKISPSGYQSLKVSDQRLLTFSADSDKCFLKWQVFSNGELLSADETNEAVDFDDINNPETSIKILKNLSEMTVQAKCEPRPKIVSVSPSYESDGVYRDRRIIIMFDKIMDKNSIYFSDEELMDLKILSDDGNAKTGYNLLKVDGNCYGYEKSGEPESTVFKNIKITNRKTGENYLQYFLDPVFDKDDLSVLRIGTKNDNPPPSVTDILVTVGKELYTTKESRITLSADYSWAYYTNGKTDSDNPNISELDVSFAIDGQSSYSSTNKKAEESPDIFDISKNGFSSDNYKNNNLANKKLWVKCRFDDTGAGPQALKWKLTKTNSSYYPCESDKEITLGQIDDLEIIGSKAEIKNPVSKNYDGTIIDFDEQLNGKKLDDGLYRLDFICSDRNELETKKTFYFIHDSTPPKQSSVTVAARAKNAADVKIGNTDIDYEKSVISSVTFKNGDTKTLDNLPGSDRGHVVSITDYDIYGNSETRYITINTTPLVGMIFYSDKTWSKEYVAGKTPIGVICDADDLSCVKIWDLYEKTGYCWGSNADPNSDTELTDYYTYDSTMGCKMNKASGLLWYTEIIKKKFPNLINYTCENKHTIWYYLEKEKNVDSPVTWYIPGPYEFKPILDNYNAMKPAYELLKNNGYDVKLVTPQEVYWTGVPNYKDTNAYAGVFNREIRNYEGLGPKKLFENSSSDLKYFACIPDGEKYEYWYCKYLDHDEVKKMNKTFYLRTHAMAQIDLN